MTKAFERIMAGLREALNFVRGDLSLTYWVEVDGRLEKRRGTFDDMVKDKGFKMREQHDEPNGET